MVCPFNSPRSNVCTAFFASNGFAKVTQATPRSTSQRSTRPLSSNASLMSLQLRFFGTFDTRIREEPVMLLLLTLSTSPPAAPARYLLQPEPLPQFAALPPLSACELFISPRLLGSSRAHPKLLLLKPLSPPSIRRRFSAGGGPQSSNVDTLFLVLPVLQSAYMPEPAGLRGVSQEVVVLFLRQWLRSSQRPPPLPDELLRPLPHVEYVE
mmetsp:Transcript_89261/g.177465  ORF Transcript_89261/g.177465 Transcript_89261/m.177465 type:complete len:210 (-) Transcript_89261:277-906(-)